MHMHVCECDAASWRKCGPAKFKAGLAILAPVPIHHCSCWTEGILCVS